MKYTTTLLCALLGALSASAFAAQTLTLSLDAASAGPGKFADEEIRREAAARGMTVVSADAKAPADAIRIVLAVGAPAGTKAAAQSYGIRVQNEKGRRTITVRGADAAGVMYGGLDVAEAIRTGTLDSLQNSDHTPHIAQRGIKINIPLDLRTPTYTDPSDAAQANIPEMWSMDYWRELFDDMARHRYNLISLWTLNPFPSIVKVPEFPHVALDDVWRTKVKLDENFSGNGNNFVRPEMLANHAHNAWYWEATHPQPYSYDEDPAKPEQVNVSVAQNLHKVHGKPVNMSSGNARGRSFHNGAQNIAPDARFNYRYTSARF